MTLIFNIYHSKTSQKLQHWKLTKLKEYLITSINRARRAIGIRFVSIVFLDVFPIPQDLHQSAVCSVHKKMIYSEQICWYSLHKNEEQSYARKSPSNASILREEDWVNNLTKTCVRSNVGLNILIYIVSWPVWAFYLVVRHEFSGYLIEQFGCHDSDKET